MLSAHIVDPRGDGSQAKTEAKIELDDHEIFFRQDSNQEGRFPLIHRFRSHFEDTRFKTHELKSLIAEIEAISASIPLSGAMSDFLQSLSNACSIAMSDQRQVLLLCD